jgi:lantibiotic leader peptide-processing serine protease
MQQGVTVVAALLNNNLDLSKRNIDDTSPDDGTPITREVTNACVAIPVEIPGVIGVSANGPSMQKSFYSNYGVGVVQVVAPGGDFPFQTPDFDGGLVWSTVPGGYGPSEGTSMASPHVAPGRQIRWPARPSRSIPAAFFLRPARAARGTTASTAMAR